MNAAQMLCGAANNALDPPIQLCMEPFLSRSRIGHSLAAARKFRAENSA
jgi:hypothetical protein